MAIKLLILYKTMGYKNNIKVGTAVANTLTSTGNNNYRCVIYGSYIYLIFI